MRMANRVLEEMLSCAIAYFRMKVLWDLNRFLESFVTVAYHLIYAFPFQVQDWYNML